MQPASVPTPDPGLAMSSSSSDGDDGDVYTVEKILARRRSKTDPKKYEVGDQIDSFHA